MSHEDQPSALVQGNGHEVVEDSPPSEATGSVPPTGDCTEEQANATHSSQKADQKKPPKRQTRAKQRRGHTYQTKDLIREISPKPERLAILVDKGAETGSGQPEKDVVLENNQTSQGATIAASPQLELLSDKHSNQQKPAAAVSILNGRRTVQCNICQRQMTESKLANHIRLLHVENGQRSDENTKRKDFRCEHCGKSYAIKYTFDQHLRTHIEGRPKCPECGSTFASAFSLFRHRAKTHNIEHNYTTHSCDQCDKIFFSTSELTLHKQRHSAEKEHSCTVCKKAFSAKGNLRIHMRTHAKEKLYKCDICENAFSHPYSLVSHRRIHTNEFPYSCTECGKSYRSKHQLNSHKNVHSDNRPFGCDQCAKTFRSRTAFKMHQDQHNGIKRFACKFCDRKFQCHANKAKHERRHLGVKRFKCDDCDKAFIERQELKNHQKVHVKQDSKETKKSEGKTRKKRLEPNTEKVEQAPATGVDDTSIKTS